MQARSELAHGCGPSPRMADTVFSSVPLAAVGWEMERGKKKGREVKANFDMYPSERFHDLRTLWE